MCERRHGPGPSGGKNVRSETPGRSLLPIILIGTALVQACASKSHQTTTNDPDAAAQIVSSTPPFQTKEPRRYQAVRTITFTDSAGNSTVTSTTIARYDDLRREDTDKGSDGAIVLIESENGRVIIFPAAKVYADANGYQSTPLATAKIELDNSPERFLHHDSISTSYQTIGPELVGGRSAVKYRVIVNNGATSNVSSSEMLVWFDEAIGMPIRSEAKAIDGSNTLMELSNIQLGADRSLFQIPAGYEKIAIAELLLKLRKN